jgi:hypothetical protein
MERVGSLRLNCDVQGEIDCVYYVKTGR